MCPPIPSSLFTLPSGPQVLCVMPGKLCCDCGMTLASLSSCHSVTDGGLLTLCLSYIRFLKRKDCVMPHKSRRQKRASRLQSQTNTNRAQVQPQARMGNTGSQFPRPPVNPMWMRNTGPQPTPVNTTRTGTGPLSSPPARRRLRTAWSWIQGHVQTIIWVVITLVAVASIALCAFGISHLTSASAHPPKATPSPTISVPVVTPTVTPAALPTVQCTATHGGCTGH